MGKYFILFSLATIGVVSVGLSIFKTLKFLIRKKGIIRHGILDMMKETPLIYIKSLSDLTGCKIYGKCEYFLPYTSKDRMIKNIILDAQS